MKASVFIATSLDGFIAREDGSLDWLPGSQEAEVAGGGPAVEDHGFQEFFDSVDVLVMGRSTFEVVRSFGQWPYGDKWVVILSSKLTQLSGDLPKSVELRSCAPAELLKDLQELGAKHAYIDGGKTIQGFLAANLIDEITITRIPVLIGQGIPLFGPLDKDVGLRHLETRSFANGFVQSKYEVHS